MNRLFLLLMVLTLSKMAHGQIITIMDEEDSEPLEWVNVSENVRGTISTTNNKGQADLSEFQNGDTILISLIGYQPKKMTLQNISESDFRIFLQPDILSLSQVVVSATKWRTEGQGVPSKVTKISPREIHLQNPQTAADLLGTSGEVYIQKSQQGGGSPMIRGFATNRLLIAVDGIRMNTAIFRGGNVQNVIALDPFVMESTEILFGPGSVLYGSDAIGGVMSFYTVEPNFALEKSLNIGGHATVRHASANNELSGHFDVNIGWEKWALVSSFTHNRFGDLKMGKNGPKDYLRPEFVQRIDGEDRVVTNEDPLIQQPTNYAQSNFMQKIRFAPNKTWDFTYGFHYSASTDYDRYDRLIRYNDDLPISAEWSYGPQVWLMNHLHLSHKNTNFFFDEMTIDLAHQFFEESRINRDFMDTKRKKRLEKVNAYSLNMDLKKDISAQKQLSYGIELVVNEVDSKGANTDIITGTVVDGPSRYPQSTWSSYAAYLLYQDRLADQVILQAGTRYNLFHLDAIFDTRFYPLPFETAEINNGALTGSLGVVWNPTSSWSISTNLSTGFRAPNVDDVGKVFDSEPGAVVVPNPNLEAEYAYNGEVSIAKIFGKKLKIDVTTFYTHLDNALVRRDFSLNGQDSIFYDGELSKVQAIQNAASANVWGIQAGFELKLPADFELSSRINYQKGEEELDDGSSSPSRHAGPLFGVGRLTYHTERLKLDLYTIFNGEIKNEDLALGEQGKEYLYALDKNERPYAPSWYTLNIKARYQMTKGFYISTGIENLTDQRYRPYSSGLAGPGRNFIISLQAKF